MSSKHTTTTSQNEGLGPQKYTQDTELAVLLAPGCPPRRGHEQPIVRARLPAPWALALATAIPLTIAYLIAQPPSGDMAAATYRGEVFARTGLALWDNGWYGGHYLPGYSVFAPALGAFVGERLLLGLCTIAAAGLFGVIVQRAFGMAGARVAAVSFALGASVTMLSGRVAFSLGLAVGLLAVVALQRRRFAAALVLALLTSLASPVAGAFLALAGVAYALAGMGTQALQQLALGRRLALEKTTEGSTRQTWHALAIAAVALAPIAAFALVFPEGGYEPFAPSVFWPGVAGVALIALLLPRFDDDRSRETLAFGEHPRFGQHPRAARVLTWGAWLYALALIGSFALHTPVGSNAARLGELFAAPLVAGALWENHRLALLILAPALLYWQLETPLNDVSELAGDPSLSASYYAPLLGELQQRAHGAPLRVEVPQTGAHWESVHLPEHGSILLARGWERQLDTRYAALFYAPTLTPTAYRAWLDENAISYVALPDVRLDFSGAAEGRLVARGLPYLREVWRSPHWRLFAVVGAPALAAAPARLTAVGADSFTLAAPHPGSYEVRVRYTPYWALQQGRGCVRSTPGGWTTVQARTAGTIHVGIDFSLGRIFDHGPRCT